MIGLIVRHRHARWLGLIVALQHQALRVVVKTLFVSLGMPVMNEDATVTCGGISHGT